MLSHLKIPPQYQSRNCLVLLRIGNLSKIIFNDEFSDIQYLLKNSRNLWFLFKMTVFMLKTKILKAHEIHPNHHSKQ